MKNKYFLRGLGTGIIFGALIMLAAYMTSGAYKITDEEIMKRAEKLGMVKVENSIPLATDSDIDADNVSSASEEVTTTEGSKEDVTEDTSTTEEASTTEQNSEEVTSEEATTEEKDNKDDKADDTYVTAKITVASGMSSTQVAQLLQDAGIISDYLDFDAYLTANGYSTQIRVKTTEFNSKMTYEEIAVALTSGKDEY